MEENIKGINVLSLFDGMSCGQIALERAGIKVNKYFASEIDKYAIKVTQANYPATIQLGDVTKVRYSDGVIHSENGYYFVGKIDLVIGGSPCQGFSFAGKQLNFEDPRSKLFFEWRRIFYEVNPKNFLLENVKMKSEYRDVITGYLGVEPVEINSALVSAQNRERLYWTSVLNLAIPIDKGLLLKDIIIHGSGTSLKNLTASRSRAKKNIRLSDQKSGCLLATGYKLAQANGMTNVVDNVLGVRCTTPIEWERLQTVPDGYTNHVSNSQRYKMLGNGWTVDLIAHIFKQMPL